MVTLTASISALLSNLKFTHSRRLFFFFFPERKKFLEARFEKSGPEEIQYQSEKEKQKDAFKQLRNQAAFLHYFTSCVSFRL
jgi:hypothetical protein